MLLAPHFEVVARACRVRSRARQRARRDLASVLPSPLASGWGGGRRARQGEGAAARPAAVCGLAVGCERFLGAALDRCTWVLRKIAAARLEDMSSKPCSGATRRCGDSDCVG